MVNLKKIKDCPDAVFWFGNQTNFENGFPGLYSNTMKAELTNLKQVSEYVHLPQSKNFKYVDSFGIYSPIDQKTCAIVSLPKEHKYPVQKHYDKSDKGQVLVRVPKCCEFGNRYYWKMEEDTVSCEEDNEDSASFAYNVLRHNETHVDDVPMTPDEYKFQPYFHNPCKHQK